MVDLEVHVQGVYSEDKFGRANTLVTYVKAIDLIEYFSPFKIPEELEEVFQQVHSRANSNRVEQIKKSILHGITNAKLAPHLSLSFALTGNVEVSEKYSCITEISYSSEGAVAVEGVLTLFAIMTLLGFEHPFEKKRASKELLVENKQARQLLANQPIQVTLIFNPVLPLTTNQAIELSELYNGYETKLISSLHTSINLANPINLYISELAELADINKFGGISLSFSKQTKNDHFITTEKIMIRLVLGALKGASAQDKNRIKGFDDCKNDLNGLTADQAKPLVANFLKSWLTATHSQFLQNKDGYHYSSQLWQALGLVIHQLLKQGYTSRQLTSGARWLGNLNYAKDASHWQHCDVMKLDKSGKQYIVASKGGRQFRIGIAKYLLALIEKNRAISIS